MRRVLLIIVIGVACCRAQAFRLGVERTRDIGHGFHRDVIAEQNPPGTFEAVRHIEYLFYRDRKLAPLNFECAVSPSGKAVVYQDGPSGLIFLFRPTEGKPVQLTHKFFGIIDEYDWHEGEGFIRVVADKYKATKKERILKIPPMRSNQSMQRTAGRAAFPLSMTSTFNQQRRALSPAVADLESR
jgi:hypothetical protein